MNDFFSRFPFKAVLAAACLSLSFAACGDDDDDDDTPDASVEDASTADAATPDASIPDASVEEDASISDASVEEDASTPQKEFTGCDLMEFAPEHRNGQERSSAIIGYGKDASTYDALDLFHELNWFEGGEEGTWSVDALRLTAYGKPVAFDAGTFQLEGADLGNNNDCEFCMDLGRSDLDNGVDATFYPENVKVTIQAADIRADGHITFTVSGVFREDADSSKRSWCVNDLPIDMPVDQYCATADTCPEGMDVCDYKGETGSYPVCQASGEEAGE